ncbi:methenyltetrahydromethanopterin cyclohydrolase [Bremerella alba]|uniref:Methenyltetrahydromethanopterin cyclohydrolase n=1 Tax=Bremerella alba TaxID=980252 RepID=A0A7V9A645_9BACT|nr:methenyltetrahydromethanopterin cyclohydrolase [Bremerella alba]MBA2114005.1 Methenyltetrahydromethanopterin cyclohydrolase [Bremerella alba]
MELNQRAHALVQPIIDTPQEIGAELVQLACGAKVLDLGVTAGRGGLEAGRQMAEICLAGLGEVSFSLGDAPGTRTFVNVCTDRPELACIASQYAGWQIKTENFFGMGSGPMRVKAAKEPVIQELNLTDEYPVAVGVLEASQLPGDDVCQKIATDCHVDPKKLVLLVARTASIAGHVQVVARSVETCLHKLHELKFDLSKIASGFGAAPLPPIAADDVVGIGRTNDAILYGGTVTLWVNETSQRLSEFGEKLPSSTSLMYGQPFEQILRDAKFDFYQIDPLLFSPAEVCLVSLQDGKSTIFGKKNLEVLANSFGQG